MVRNNRIFDGSEPPGRPKKFIGPGRQHSALFLMPHTVSLRDQLEFVHEEFAADMQVLAVDAALFDGPSVPASVVTQFSGRVSARFGMKEFLPCEN